MLNLGGWDWVILLVIVLIVFGVGKLPDVGKQLGKGIRDFKKYSSGAEDEGTKAAAESGTASAELDVAKAKLEAAEAKLKIMEESAKKKG